MSGLKKIVWHWTAGGYEPNSTDFEHYHYLIGYDTKTGQAYIKEGKYKPSDNVNCYDGAYAAHTGGGNTGAIGISLCGMAGYKNPKNQGKYPLKRVQFEKAFELTAKLCKQYGIVISPATVYTHYEFGLANPKTLSARKIDINFIPYKPDLAAHGVGDFIRNKIQWYYNKL